MRLRDVALRIIGGKQEQRAIDALPWDVGGPARPSTVTAEQALGLVPVFAAVRILASQVASLPLQTYRKTSMDTRDRIPDPSLFRQPSVQGTVYDWLHRCVTSLALRGNAYGYVTQRDRDQYPTMVEWLHPDDIRCDDRQPSGPGSFTKPVWYWQGKMLPAEDLVHIAWFTVPGRVQGLSPIGACAATIATGISAQAYTSDWFDNGAVPPGEFKNTAKTVNQTEADIISARLNAAIRRRKPLVYGNDWEYKPISVSAHEAKFVETMRLNATQVAAIYGIPAEMVGGEAGGPLTYNTVESNAAALEKFTLRPWLELLEYAFSALLPRPQYVKFNLDALLRTNIKDRLEAFQIARNIGLHNLDEIRALEEHKPLPDGQGQDYTPLPILTKQAGAQPAEVRTWDLPTREAEFVRRATRQLSGPEALLELQARRDDPHHPAALDVPASLRKFNPGQARNPHTGEWIDTTPGDSGHGGFLERLAEALTGQDALDATPATLTPAPNGHSGDYAGGHLDGPSGMGSVRALNEYEGLEYQTTNITLRKGWRKPETPEDFRWQAEREAEVAARAAEIDKTMAVSQLTADVQVHRVVKDGSTVFGRDVWYGGIIDFTTTDFDEMDAQEDRWISGERPDLTGLEWREDAYSSTTVDPAVVEYYAKRFDITKSALSGGAVVLNILAPKGTGAVQMSGLGNRQEAEILLQRGLRMRVVKDHGEDENGRRILDVEVVPDVD